MNSKVHYPQLDGVRALAIMLVMVHHFAPGVFVLQLGPLGVRLFFALSGFLITRIVLQCKRDVERNLLTAGTALRQFYIRRFLRIFPAYYLLLAIAVVFHRASLTSGLQWHLLYLSNFYMAAKGSHIGTATMLWSLSVEEQFYLFWPTLLMWIPRKWEGAAAVVLIAIAPLSRALFFTLGANEVSVYVLPTSSMDCLGLGAWLAIAGRDSILWRMLPVGIIGALACRVFPGNVWSIAGESLFGGLLAVWLVAWAWTGIPGVAGRFLEWKPIRYVGMISYGMYLCHSFVGAFVDRLRLPVPSGFADVVHFAISAALSIGVASVSWYCFERPINQLKDRFPYRPKEKRETETQTLLARAASHS